MFSRRKGSFGLNSRHARRVWVFAILSVSVGLVLVPQIVMATSPAAGNDIWPDVCKAAFDEEPLSNLDELIERLGVNSEKIFDNAVLKAGCTHAELVELLSTRRGFHHTRTLPGAGGKIVERFTYMAPFSDDLVVLPVSIALGFSSDGKFIRSNWGVANAL